MPERTVAEVRDVDLQSIVDEELGRLPDHYRAVLVLCDLEGRTRKEAARQLAIPAGSVGSRLARGRVLLAKRLTRRGIVLSGGAVAAALAAGAASASAPPALVVSTIKAASLYAAGQAAGLISIQVAGLTEGVLKTMFVMKLKTVLAAMLAIASLSGAAGLIYQTRAAEQPQTDPLRTKPAAARSDENKLVRTDAKDASAKVQRLEDEVERLRAANGELKKRLQQQVHKGKDSTPKVIIKVYPVAGLTDAPDPEQKEADALMRVITRTIDPTSWGEMGGNGSIQYLQSAGSIIVRQTPDNHKQVQELLDALRKNRTEQEKAAQQVGQ